MTNLGPDNNNPGPGQWHPLAKKTTNLGPDNKNLGHDKKNMFPDNDKPVSWQQQSWSITTTNLGPYIDKPGPKNTKQNPWGF